jgi:apolipoprotein N-acyltransferase
LKLVNTFRRAAAILGHPIWTKRTAKICCGLIAAVLLLHFYYIRELLLAEAALAIGFIVVALIGAVYVLGCIAVSRLWRRALVSVRHRQPFSKTTVTGLSNAKEEVS